MSSDLVTVFVPADAWQRSLAESALDEAEIVYSSQNAQTQDLLGAGQIGGIDAADLRGVENNVVVGPVQIRVGAEDAERARRLIAEVISDAGREDLPADLEDDAPEDKAAASRSALAYRYANVSIVWSILWIAGLGSLLAVYYGIRSLRLSPHPSRAKAIFALVLGIVGLGIWFLAWGPEIFGWPR